MNYSEWNNALFGRFFEGRSGDVTLYVDVEVLSEIANMAPVEAFVDFRGALSSVCASSLERHIRFALFRLAKLRRGEEKLPGFLPTLAALVLAWTVDPEDASPQNYIERLRDILDIPRSIGYPGNWSKSDLLWVGLREWCASNPGPRFSGTSRQTCAGRCEGNSA